MFFEEARELLISLEEGLMDLERRQTDRAHLDKTFRAAHSVKGAAAMVGLGAIAEFTHHIEAVLDKIRSHLLAIDSDIITTLLEARDHLAAMVEAEAARSPIPASGELTQRLVSLLRGPRRSQGGCRRQPAANAARSSARRPAPIRCHSSEQPIAKTGCKTRLGAGSEAEQFSAVNRSRTGPWRIAARSGENAGTGPEHLPGHFDARSRRFATRGQPAWRPRRTARSGRDDNRHQRRADVPLLDRLDPERCYLSWAITVTTDVDAERLGEAFLFFAEDSTAAIESLGPDGKWVPVRLGESMTAGVGGAQALSTRRPGQPAADVTAAVEPAVASTLINGSASPSVAPAVSTSSEVPVSTAASAAALLPRLHARIRVDASQLDESGGFGRRACRGIRQLDGPARNPRRGNLDSCARGTSTRQPADQGHHSRTADGPRRRAFLAIPPSRPRPRRPIRQGYRATDHRPGNAARPHDCRTALRPDDSSDPQCRRPRARAPFGAARKRQAAAWAESRSGPATKGTASQSGLKTTAGASTARRSSRRESRWAWCPPGTPADDPRVVGLIFEPGFSTRDTVSELSGRGVGLDVVRDAVRELRGSVAVESTPGKGTAFVFRLPLTLALIDGLLVETAGGRYVVPLAQVEECIALNGIRSALSYERACVAVRGELVPMVSLRNLFRADGASPPRQELLLTRHAGQRVGVAVDRLVGRVQAVIQSLGEGLHGLTRFSGATILGDGSVSLILDLSALVSESRFAEHSARATPFAGGGRPET